MHPSLWYILKGARQARKNPHEQPVPEAGRPPAHNWIKGERVGAVLIYVDDLLTSASRKISEAMFKALGKFWELSSPEYLGTGRDDVDVIRFLGMDIELGTTKGSWIAHQQAYIIEVLQRFSADLVLKKRTTPGEPESFSAPMGSKSFRDDQNGYYLPSMVGSLLWLSLRTRPDIAWSVSRIASLAANQPEEARIRIKQVLQYLRWTIDYCLVFVPCPQEFDFLCFTDASLSPTGEKSQQGVVMYAGPNLVAWVSNRQSLVALSSAEAELIAAVAGTQLAMSLRTQLEEYMQREIPLVLRCDNAAVLQLVTNLSSSSSRTRHLAMRAAWLHHMAQGDQLKVEFVPTDQNKADSLTKGLSTLLNDRARIHLRLARLGN